MRHPQQLTTTGDRFEHPRSGLGPGGRLTGHAIRGGARPSLRNGWRGHVHHRQHRGAPIRGGHDAVYLDQRRTGAAHLGRDDAAHPRQIGRAEILRRQSLCNARGLFTDDALPLLIVVGGDAVGRRQDLVDRRVEPAIDGREHDAAANQQHEHRRDDGHPQHRQHELGAEAGERQAAAPLDDGLDDVARQQEHQRQEHREVGGRERVQHDLGQEVGGQARGAILDHQQARQHREQHDDARKDQARVVPEGPARSRLRGRHGRRRTNRRGGTSGWHGAS